MDAGWNASAKRYTGGKILVANLPGVDIGSTIEVEYQISAKDKPFLSGFEPSRPSIDVDKKDVRLTAPAESPSKPSLPVRTASSPHKVTTANGYKLSQWTAET